MAEQQEIIDSTSAQVNPESTENMELESSSIAEKRGREEEEENRGDSKKVKVEDEAKSMEEEKKNEVNGSGRVKLGPKEFVSSVELFDYFNKLLHSWPNNLDVNKYEQMVLLDLIKKGHLEPEKKIGDGIKAFQIRNHPMWKSKCFFLIREDDTTDDFSFRKCVDHILPLPENMRAPNASHGGRRGGRGGGGGGRGGGRFKR